VGEGGSSSWLGRGFKISRQPAFYSVLSLFCSLHPTPITDSLAHSPLPGCMQASAPAVHWRVWCVWSRLPPCAPLVWWHASQQATYQGATWCLGHPCWQVSTDTAAVGGRFIRSQPCQHQQPPCYQCSSQYERWPFRLEKASCTIFLGDWSR
jgi:hypothetical protein